ncbi:MAG: PDZ domain-containing protein [Desulfobacterales bacterium]|nr:PDZ domain-containing protein [Desulfobacterales bacterium]
MNKNKYNFHDNPIDIPKTNTWIWLGPVSVIAFITFLAVMYGGVGNMGEPAETPEMALVNQQTQTQTAPVDNAQDKPPVQTQQQPQTELQGGQLVHQGISFPAGIGNTPMQLINKPTFPAGIGNGPDAQMQLIKQNQAVQPYLGLSVGEVTEAIAAKLKLKPGTGVYVKQVIAGSPAEKAGIQSGDVVLKCDHQAITAHEQIGVILRSKKPGDVLKLIINRDGKTQSFHVKLENAPQNLLQAAAGQQLPTTQQNPTQNNPTWMGADIQDIDAVMKLQYQLPDTKGVIVSYVNPNSPAQTSGIQTGDVIQRFNGTRIRDVAQFQELILNAQPGNQVPVIILRNGEIVTIPVVLGQKSPEPAKPSFLGPVDMAIEGTWIGMDVSELSPGDVSALGLPTGTQGILVNDVESPPALTLGFQTNDVIIAINGVPTTEMKKFAEATKNQSSAVVDVVRGNRHMFITVPPPGYTRQGTQINDPLNKTLKQVQFTDPLSSRIAIIAQSPDIYAPVSGDTQGFPYVILVDRSQSAYAVLEPNQYPNLTNLISQYQINVVICSSMTNQTAKTLASQGVFIYAGVIGSANDAVSLYESNRLTPMKGL